MLVGLTFWQGPWGFQRGTNGFRGALPRDFEFNDNSGEEAGIKRSLKGLRVANFVIGCFAVLIAIAGICGGSAPSVLKVFALVAALLFFGLGCVSGVSFAMGIDEIRWIKNCPDLTFPINNINYNNNNVAINTNIRSPSTMCRLREQITTAAIVADGGQSVFAFFAAFLLIYTTMHANWAWGPGYVPVERSANAPRVQFPPPSPFTHIAETRRVYVWLAILATLAFVIIAFILTLKLHELRIKPKYVDSRNNRLETPGWYQTNNRMRASIGGITIGLVFLTIMDAIVWRKRLIAYTLGILMFWAMVGFIIIFCMDIKQIGDAKRPSCPTGSVQVPIRCVYWPYYGTVFVDFFCSFIIMIYLFYEYLYRINGTWDTYYFYADSEWLRNHSLFVEQTDREAYDWKQYTMDTGKSYYYSPSLGISTRVVPGTFK